MHVRRWQTSTAVRNAALVGPGVDRPDGRANLLVRSAAQPKGCGASPALAGVARGGTASHHPTPPRPGGRSDPVSTFFTPLKRLAGARRSRTPGTPGVRPSAVPATGTGGTEAQQAGDGMRTHLTCHRPDDPTTNEVSHTGRREPAQNGRHRRHHVRLPIRPFEPPGSGRPPHAAIVRPPPRE